MKKVLIILSLLSAFQASAESIGLKDLTEKVKTGNYVILEKAERVYQAKKSIDEARGRLLPTLNLWKIASIVVDPTSLLDSVNDIAPFLVPSNWFILKERSILFLAEKEAYRALWANELQSARATYLKVLMDQTLLRLLSSYEGDLAELQLIVQSRFQLGLERQEIVRDIEIRYLSIQEDKQNVELLVREEKRLLTYMMGLEAEKDVDLVGVDLPNVPSAEKPDYDKLVGRMLTVSPETKQNGHLQRVIPWIKREQAWSFLGGSALSRGVAGGVFDHLPSPDGLGFATAPGLKIINSEARILEIQKRGITETLKRQLKASIDLISAAIDISPLQSKKVNLSEENIEQLKDRLRIGEKINLVEMANYIQTKNLAKASWLETQYRFMFNRDRLNRLLFWEDYDLLPGAVEGAKK